MPTVKELRVRIRSLRNTRKITAAMQLVASAKYRKAQAALLRSRPWAERTEELCSRAVAAAGTAHPLAEPREVRRARVIVASSDRGLCGSFNNRAIGEALRLCAELSARGKEVEVVAVGRRALDRFAADPAFAASAPPEETRGDAGRTAAALAESAAADFLSKKVDEVWIVYNRFESMLSQRPTSAKLLPAETDPAPAGAEDGRRVAPEESLFEPSPAALLDVLLPLRLRARTLLALLESQAGEHGARMAAMDNATRNSGDLIDRLTLMANRARQSAITTELTEIVSGAEALKS